MDLQHLRIHLPDDSPSAVDLQVLDGEQPRAVTLSGEAAARVTQAAAPLLARLAGEPGGDDRGAAAALEVDFLAQTLQRGEVRRQGEGYQQLSSLLRDVARVALREVRPRVPEPALPVSDAERWEQRYHSGGDGWELWRPAPPLQRYLEEHPLTLPLRALVIGAGRGHEARLLARLGADVTALDFAATAVAECQRLARAEGLTMTVRQADLFDLPGSDADAGAYDLLLEHTCFCAIDPARRDEYVATVAALLRPGGRLLGLFYCHGDPGGPPYGATPAEIDGRFAPRFTTLHREVPPDSVATRASQELLVLYQRR